MITGCGKDKLEDGYFFSTIENIEENTTLSEHKQRKAINNLQSLGLISIKIKGIPAKRYFKINEDQVLNFFKGKFLKNSGTGSLKIEELDTEKLKGNNNIINNNKKESKKESFDDLINFYTENEELRAELKNHLATRKAKKATLTNRAIELSFIELNKLANNDSEKIEIVRQSIRNGWTGFFALKNKKVEQKPKESNFSGRDYDNLNQFYIN